MKTYLEIKEKEPELDHCFFAFSKEQLEEGLQKWNLTRDQIKAAPAGLYGTSEGIKKFLSFYEMQREEIAKECDPQEVYAYEFNNHKCGYIGDDEDAIMAIIFYFGKDIAKTVKRTCGYYNIV